MIKLADRKLKRVTLIMSKDYKAREMETVKEDASETSRDFLKNKPERKSSLPEIDKKFNIKRNLSEFENIAINY